MKSIPGFHAILLALSLLACSCDNKGMKKTFGENTQPEMENIFSLESKSAEAEDSARVPPCACHIPAVGSGAQPNCAMVHFDPEEEMEKYRANLAKALEEMRTTIGEYRLRLHKVRREIAEETRQADSIEARMIRLEKNYRMTLHELNSSSPKPVAKISPAVSAETPESMDASQMPDDGLQGVLEKRKK